MWISNIYTVSIWIQYTLDLLSFHRTAEGEQATKKNGTEMYMYVCMLSTVLFQVSLNHLADVNKVGAFESQPEWETIRMAVRANHFDWLNVNSRERNEAENENRIDTKHTLTQNHSIKNGVHVFFKPTILLYGVCSIVLFVDLFWWKPSKAE